MNPPSRYLRIFHGGSAIEINSTIHQGEPWYVAYDTKAMREGYWGLDEGSVSAPEATEWQAYIDNEVYGVLVELLDEDGHVAETIEGPIFGHYGEEYAVETAIEWLKAGIEAKAIDDAAAERYRNLVEQKLIIMLGEDVTVNLEQTEQHRADARTHGYAAQWIFETITIPRVIVTDRDPAMGTGWAVQIDTHELAGNVAVHLNDSTIYDAIPTSSNVDTVEMRELIERWDEAWSEAESDEGQPFETEDIYLFADKAINILRSIVGFQP